MWVLKQRKGRNEMKLLNDLISEDTNNQVLASIAKFKSEDSDGYAAYIEGKVESEHDFYKGHMINSSSVERMNGLKKEYNAVIVSFIRGLSDLS
jgi:hypothetical protein